MITVKLDIKRNRFFAEFSNLSWGDVPIEDEYKKMSGVKGLYPASRATRFTGGGDFVPDACAFESFMPFVLCFRMKEPAVNERAYRSRIP